MLAQVPDSPQPAWGRGRTCRRGSREEKGLELKRTDRKGEGTGEGVSGQVGLGAHPVVPRALRTFPAPPPPLPPGPALLSLSTFLRKASLLGVGRGSVPPGSQAEAFLWRLGSCPSPGRVTLTETRPVSGHAWGLEGMRTEDLAQTSRDPLSAPGLLTMPMRLHLNCAVYTRLSSTAPHQPPSWFLQPPGWLGSTLHAHCSCCNCMGCPQTKPHFASPLAFLRSSSKRFHYRRSSKPASACCTSPPPTNGRAGAAHTHLACCDLQDNVNVPPPLRPQLPLADPLADPLSSKIIGSPESPTSGSLP